MRKFFKEFKEFATKGNVVDMAIGLVIGTAFKDIVNALVNNIISPLIGLLTGGASLAEQKYVLSEAVVEVVDGVETIIEPENAILWGAFVQTIIDFLIIAFSIFVVIKVATAAHRKAEEAKRLILKQKEEEAKEEEAAPPEPSSTDKLLIEIRDLLKENEKK